MLRPGLGDGDYARQQTQLQLQTGGCGAMRAAARTGEFIRGIAQWRFRPAHRALRGLVWPAP